MLLIIHERLSEIKYSDIAKNIIHFINDDSLVSYSISIDKYLYYIVSSLSLSITS